MLPRLALLLFLSIHCVAQDKGTCRCCELGRIYAPYLKDLPTPKKRDNIGNSHLKITTKSPAAQQWFDQGLNLLHAFWEFEAYRCFLQAAKEDPDCAMAYWGVCMSLPGKNPESSAEREAALAKAKDLAGNQEIKITALEKLYIDTAESLVKGGTKSAIPGLKLILKKFPEDAEATAFLALWLRDGYSTTGKPKSGTKEAIALLEKALKKHPQHTGLNHYYIHVLEQGPDFNKARKAAIELPKVAPDAGHLVHMPGHIYYLAGEYEKACQAFRDCHKVESAYLEEEQIPAVDNQNYLHNLHFLAYAAADQGRYKEALKASTLLAEAKVPDARSQAIGAHQIYYLSSTVTALVHMRSGKYDLAAASLLPDAIPNNSGARHYVLFLRSYCRLRHAITHPEESGSAQVIQREKLALSQHLKALQSADPGKTAATQPWAQALTACKILRNEARAWIENAKPNKAFKKTWASIAIRESNRAGYTEPPLLIVPVEESLGWLALHVGDHKQAKIYFTESLKERPNSGHAYLGIARSYRRLDDTKMACENYQKLLDAFLHADKNLPVIQEAKNFLAEHQKTTEDE
ncbi:MAG: tetratricopeptide repeat protein [Akkermansiaceae bacterium]